MMKGFQVLTKYIAQGKPSVPPVGLLRCSFRQLQPQLSIAPKTKLVSPKWLGTESLLTGMEGKLDSVFSIPPYWFYFVILHLQILEYL